MKRYLYIIILILCIGLFADSPVFSADIDDDDKATTGILVKVDLKSHVIYLRENSRIVKFKASADICEKFKDKLNMAVDITYDIGSNKTLLILTIKLSDIQPGKDKGDDKPKAGVKVNPKKRWE